MTKPSFIRGAEKGSFAEYTLTQRLPYILKKVLADNPNYGTVVKERINRLLINFPYKTISPPATSGPFPNADIWECYLQQWNGATWLEVPFIEAEGYFYWLLLAETDYFSIPTDPFAIQKRKSEPMALAKLLPYVSRLNQEITQLYRSECLVRWLYGSLWGNSADLSQSPGWRENLALTPPPLLVDDTPQLCSLLAHPRQRMDWILDNVGEELFADLCVCDYLLSTDQLASVHLHFKPYPVFVSDATLDDWKAALTALTDYDALTRIFAQRLQKHQEQGRITVTTHGFWGTTLALQKLPSLLQESFMASSLLVLKGDLNYRRWLEDRHWAYDTPLAQVEPTLPIPVLALRTLKSEMVVGLDAEILDRVSRETDWLTSGKYGLIQGTL